MEVRITMWISTEDQQRWLQQWRAAAFALAKQKAGELAALTVPEARKAMLDLLALAALTPLPSERLYHSGLVEQQRIFQRARPHEQHP